MQSFIQNKSLNILFMLILLGLAIYLTWSTSKQYKSIFRNQSPSNTQNNLIIAKTTEKDTIKYEETSNNKSLVKMKFENVYNKFIWGSAGGGSGGGSTINYTTSIRSILRQIINEYSIESMLDAPCGSFHWMPLFLKDIAEDFKRRGKRFRYHGVDVVERLISSARANYSNEPDWSFSVCDFSAEALPDDFDLILSRDSLMHLSYQKIVDSLRMFSRVKGAKYLLTTSYLGRYGYNRNIEVGQFFEINLLAPPFKLKRFKRIFHEYNDQKSDHKSIVLYDIPNYLSKVNFDRMKRISANIKPPKSYSRIF